MKRFLPIILLIIGLTTSANAQWTSPGDGTTYTLPDLVTVSHGTVTISPNDALLINNQVTRINAIGVLITIQGSINCTNNARVSLYGSESPSLKFSMRFENATNCHLQKLYLSDGCGIKLIESDVVFDDVKFVYFTQDYSSSVIDIFNCNPTINNCFFMLNDGPAISSPANGQSSPQITNCQFDCNSDKSTNPQVNLGPGSTDTILISGNTFDGTYDINARVGGLSIADLMGVGDTKVKLVNNTFKEGRYGYNQQGQSISSVIIGNQFINNSHENNPMNGGSGISIYGYSTNCKALLRNNIITGNLWGITAIYYHDIDMGTIDDWGNNTIRENGNNGITYDLYNNSSCDLMAVGNDWGTIDLNEIKDHIVDQTDDPSLGLVTFIPYVGYSQLEENASESMEFDLSKATFFTITGQRVNPESLKPGIYVVVTDQGTKKIIIQ